MNELVLDVWRTAWPKAIPAHEYEAALQMAALIGIIGRKPEAESAREPERPAAKKAPSDLIGPNEAAKLLGIRTAAQVYVWAKNGDIGTYAVDGKARFSRAEVLGRGDKRRGRPTRGPRAPKTPGTKAVRDDDPVLLSAPAAAALAGLSDQAILWNMRKGDITAHSQKGRAYLFERSEIERWIATRGGKNEATASAKGES